MTAPVFNYYLGIDVSKATLDVCLLAANAERPCWKGWVANSTKGHEELLKLLSAKHIALDQVHCVFEATGSCTHGLERFLHAHQVPYSMVNPAQIKFFGRSLNVRTKTDAADAHLIARYGQERRPVRNQPFK